MSTFPAVARSLVQDNSTDGRPSTSEAPARDSAEPATIPEQRTRRFSKNDVGGRRTVAEQLKKFADKVSTPSQDTFDLSQFRGSKANDFPEIPGERMRNNKLDDIKRTYDQPRDDDDSRSVRSARPRSRAASFNGSMRSGFGVDRNGLTRSRTTSPVRPHASPLSGTGSSSEPHAPATDPTGARIRIRRDTLEVPSAAPRTPTRQTTIPTAGDPAVTFPVNIGSPVIVISDSEAPTSPGGLAIILPEQSPSAEAAATPKASTGT